MKHIVGISFAFFCLWSVNAHAEVSPLWNGHYRVEQFGEKLIDGSQVYIQYDFQIDSKNDQASVAMTTWHAPISCIGNYNIRNDSEVLALQYSAENKDSDCHYSAPQFEIKRKGNDYYVKGTIFTYSSSGEWLRLKKISS
ncbi:hypothetical protein [Rahnella laticis]|uniref:hypothetical protein n=1 Tax=Rahnella laticis TaxID=2787622 RepID=UPI0018A26EBA|nr:hypothetical protein [Rahnella laticis]MBF7997625.1 hypothetical protein [Rahnella laticis]